MPRYFFHIVTKAGVVLPDETGVELPDADAARQEADRTIAGLLRDRERGGRDYAGGVFEVRSEDDRQVFTWAIHSNPDPKGGSVEALDEDRSEIRAGTAKYTQDHHHLHPEDHPEDQAPSHSGLHRSR